MGAENWRRWLQRVERGNFKGWASGASQGKNWNEWRGRERGRAWKGVKGVQKRAEECVVLEKLPRSPGLGG